MLNLTWDTVSQFRIMSAVAHRGGAEYTTAHDQFEGAVHGHSAFEPHGSVTIKDVTIAKVTLLGGEGINDPDATGHIFGMAPGHPTITPVSWDTTKLIDFKWRPNGIGYIPPNGQLHSVILEPSMATYVRVPDHIFRAAALETVDPSTLDYRWMGDIDDPIALHVIKSMEQTVQISDLAGWPLIMESLGTTLAVTIMRKLGAKPLHGDVPYQNGLPQARLSRVIEYIDTNLHKPITLTEIAGVAILSPFHFSRAFKKSMNVSPARYVWQRRVERAKNALRYTTIPLAIIAYDSGFSSQSHFSTMFKREVGITPLKYRAQVGAS